MYPSPMAWRIRGQVGPHTDPDKDGSGWLWEIDRGEEPNVEVRRILVTVTGQAFDLPNGRAEDASEAIRTEGRSEIERVIMQDDPPLRIACSHSIVEDYLN